jgi:predicted Zn-dependent peptidase
VEDDQVVVGIYGLRENFDTAVALLESLLTEGRPDETALQELKNATLQSRLNEKMDKDAIKLAQQFYAIYGPGNPFNYVLSNSELKEVQSKDLVSLLHSLTSHEHEIYYYGPEKEDSLISKLKRLHSIPSDWIAPPAAMKFNQISQTKPKVIFTDYDAVQAEIQWVRNLDQYAPQKEAIADLFNSYFGGGMGSVVVKTIREAKGLAYSTEAEVVFPKRKDDKFTMVAYLGCQADKLKESVGTMDALLKKMPKINPDYIASQQNLLQDIETERIVQDEIISNYLMARKKGIDHDIRADKYYQYKQLKLEDVSRYHQQLLSGKPYTYCVLASEEKINVDDLKKYGELKVLTLEQLFGF